MRAHAVRGQHLGDDAVGVGGGIGQHGGVFGQLRQTQCRGVRQRMPGRADDDQRIGPDDARLQMRQGLGGQGDDAQFQLAGQHRVAGHFGVHEVHVEVHLRKVARKGAQHRRQAMQAYVMTGADAQPPADLAGKSGQGATPVLDVVQGLAGIRQQGASGVGEADAAADAVEQRAADLLLQGGDAFADGGLRQVQVGGGARERLAVGHFDEGGEQLGVHGVLLGECRGGSGALIIPEPHVHYDNDSLELSMCAA